MKSWRERIVEAEGRQAAERARRTTLRYRVGAFFTGGDLEVARFYGFVDEDKLTWREATSCPAGRAASEYGVPLTSELWNLGNHFGVAMYEGDIAACHRLLDAIEDRALELKRAQG